MALLCDTGPLLAALDRDDPDHARCVAVLAKSVEDLVVPGPVIVELNYWCRKLGLTKGWHVFMEDIERGSWIVDWPTSVDLTRAHELERTYADLDVGIVDGVIIAMAERYNEKTICTLDQRHFGVIRPAHVAAFELVP